MTQVRNFTWDQGSDLDIKLIYKEGPTVKTAVPIDLSLNYSVRMDIVMPTLTGGKERLYTFNSADILTDMDPDTEGDQTDEIIEGTLSSGANKTPNIHIKVPRAITLPGGPLYLKMNGNNRTNLFQFDVFLRNDTTDSQVKVLQGTITVKESHTLWL